MPTVTYNGPTDPADPSTRYRTESAKGERFSFAAGVPVADVPAEVAKALRADKAHSFEISEKAES